MFYLSTNDKGGKKGTFQFSQRPGVKCNSWWQGVRSSHAIFTDSPAEYIFIQELCVCLAFSASFCHPEHAFTTIFLWLNRKSLLLSLGPLNLLVGATCHPKDFLSFFFDGHKYQNWSTVWRSNDSIISLSVCYLLSLLIGRREAKSLDFDERQHATTHTEQHTRHWRHNTQNTGPTIFTPIRFQLAIARRLLTGKEDEIKRRVNVPTVSSKWQISNHFSSSSSDQAFQRSKHTRPRFDS